MSLHKPSLYKTLFILVFVMTLGTGFKLITANKQPPDENRFKRVVLVKKLYNPMELEVAPNGDIYLIEANGMVGIFPITGNKLMEITNTVTPVKGKHDLYIVYRNGTDVINPMQLGWVSFSR